jgi:hypothetical protein
MKSLKDQFELARFHFWHTKNLNSPFTKDLSNGISVAITNISAEDTSIVKYKDCQITKLDNEFTLCINSGHAVTYSYTEPVPILSKEDKRIAEILSITDLTIDNVIDYVSNYSNFYNVNFPDLPKSTSIIAKSVKGFTIPDEGIKIRIDNTVESFNISKIAHNTYKFTLDYNQKPSVELDQITLKKYQDYKINGAPQYSSVSKSTPFYDGSERKYNGSNGP